jgi:hypothetical protein
MTDIAVYQPPAAEIALRQIDDWAPILGQVADLASKIASSPFVPDGLRGSVPAVAAAILTARELNVPPMTGLANIHVIKGKPALSALLMRALIQAQGHDWQDGEVTDAKAVVRGRRKGEAEWTVVEFTAAQARAAKIDLGGYPQDKLYARATSRLARRKFADVIAGMPYSAEELEDEPGDTTTEPAAPSGPLKAADILGQATPKTASPATPAPRAPEPQPTPPAERVAGEVPDDRPAPPIASGQVGIIQSHFSRLGYSDDDRDARLRITARLAGLDDVGSTKELDQQQAARVIEHLSRCRDMDALTALLEDGEIDG